MKPVYFYDVFETPLGPLTSVVNAEGAVTEVFTSDATERLKQLSEYTFSPSSSTEVRLQLEQYASGERHQFELVLQAKGTSFQFQVWTELVLIPYGETRSYGQLAAQLGNPKGSRAVGRANATNPIGIIVPCHRVIGSSGELTGYAGGLPFKQKLLELEGAIRPSLFGL